jgi:ABC-2 type transport system permease protein
VTALRWVPHAWSVEVRKLLSYRTDFWIDFAGSLVVQVVMAYFLWRAIFEARQVTVIGGYTFGSMMLYYLLVPLVEKITRGQEMGFLSTEIYDGSLNRYLVYPVNLFAYKLVQHAAIATLALAQLVMILGGAVLVLGRPEGIDLGVFHVLAGLGAAAVAGVLYFLLAGCLEMVAFWADNVWSLSVMLRFAIRLLGGGMIPLALFPAWSIPVLERMPFAYLLSFPIRTLMGEVSAAEYAAGMLTLVAWIVVFAALTALVWRRGTLQYSGVGI